ncbi:LPXTG cell wall anchor domain-containing protein [Vagococcus sp. BWB3-3]|uniref:LPXTG cell wall anchor domain-containing protein n=1 Tax=Vagococcus allomyrinae TaxID=2794353 RepID=A0A940STU2_9ENTE|nr:LPXTG cell wall anchor domain-containing protein [Vagococcus allomyrinae]MBP1039416.1 LPXTG cell wall anchor domain-containing protein [Vagococcus allomyrinae]
MNLKKKFTIVQLFLCCWLLLAPASTSMASEMTVDVGIEFEDVPVQKVEDPPTKEPTKKVVGPSKKVVTLPQTGEVANRSILSIGGLLLISVSCVVGTRMKGEKE